MKNTRIMMTQPMGGSQGDIYAIAATVKELNAIYQVWCATGVCVTVGRVMCDV
jgi:ATP-dependent protease ClpP protease subunit